VHACGSPLAGSRTLVDLGNFLATRSKLNGYADDQADTQIACYSTTSSEDTA
jgi:hypothetical protein